LLWYAAEDGDNDDDAGEYADEREDNGGRLNVNMMWSALKCDHIFLEERPIHSEIEWKRAIEIYNDIMNEGSQKLEFSGVKGFRVLVEAKQSPGKGRGIFAAQTIRKGEIVWTSKRTARFDNAVDYIEFIFELDPPFACDVLQWAYIQDISTVTGQESPNLKISVDLDEGSFCNDSGYGIHHNLGCDPNLASQVHGGCTSNYFALHDIEVGEELLCDYSSFAIPDGWHEFGL
jgi:Proteins containing SET domain